MSVNFDDIRILREKTKVSLNTCVPVCVKNELRELLPDECMINMGEWLNDGAWRKELYK
ncbi:hypothetical protein [Acetivibrio clariflavus]|uniref:Uncharacterized protein n=1 Tax=Acetivibrio clariflavus (strain DSM 19732 / NBRC 101661 / EBR45) TaxID=720554 RepID=G8LZN4_ACECE|nr:hypothetical protein [Acetivibrio clariflavus]AEV67935.1 hypothetical protein Clocl_1278 [Acetivibrio clariflavus DSM 19732]